jgi:hypothetical protein
MKDDRGTEGLFLLRSRRIGAERPRNPYANQSINQNQVVDFINTSTFQIFLPRHVSAYDCHPKGVVSA